MKILLILMFASLQVYAKNTAWVLEIDGAIGPATADYIKRGLADAQNSGVKLVILTIDTPGGLDISIQEIAQSITASSIPVVSYVKSSKATSASIYILYASHIAVMAPGTNLGVAIQVGVKSKDNTIDNKIVNDAEAYLLSLAQIHERNPKLAIEIVRNSASLSAQEALAKGVIDLIATNKTELLAKINAKSIKLLGQEHRILTDGIKVIVLEPDWRNKLLTIISNPNVAYILLLLGIYGIFFELSSPGSILPGVLGSISILLALFAFQILPVNFSGIALILLGILFLMAEAFIPSFGALGLGGLVAFIIGSVILIDTEVQDYTISRPLIGGFGIVTVIFFLWVLKIFIRTRTKQALGGHEEMIGEEGKCLSNENGRLRVFIHSEIWKAEALVPIESGQRIKVTKIDGLILTVEPADNP